MTTYKQAGVDKEEGYLTVDKIKKDAASTHDKNVLSTLGGFGALYELSGYKNPVLVSGTDGVGTKIKLALEYKKYETIGLDCFAMCANDILCSGAKPLFFLDYIACGKLHSDVAASIIQGMIKACKETSTSLIGGETAEMPVLYKKGDYDVAGFCVGVVEKQDIIDGSKIKQGDLIIGLPSSGVHSNGFSLIHKIFSQEELCEKFNQKPLYETLLTPTRIYHHSIHKVLKNFSIHGLSHITGGGIYENLPRIIPEGLLAVVEKKNIPITDLFKFIEERGNISPKEMWATFNMGVGMVLITPKENFNDILDTLSKDNQQPFVMGKIEKGKGGIALM